MDQKFHYRDLRIFIGFNDTAGYYSSLSHGFNSLGINSSVLFTNRHKYGYDQKRNLSLIQRLFYFIDGFSSNLFRRLLRNIFLFIVFPYYFFTNDVFIFSSGSSFLKLFDLPLYGIFNKKIVFVFTGSDIRPAHLNLNYYNFSENDVSELILTIHRQRTLVRKLELYKPIIISHPAISQYIRTSYFGWLYIGFPSTLDKTDTVNIKKLRSNYIRILHSPSNPLVKGTKRIKRIVTELQKELPFEIVFDCIEETISRADLVERIRLADLVVDQMYIDVPLSGLGVEAALVGVPTLLSGYYSESIIKDYEFLDLPTSFYVHPDKFKQKLKELIYERKQLPFYGQEAKKYVLKKWSPEAVASNYLKILSNKYPDYWIMNNSSNFCLYPLYEFDRYNRLIQHLPRYVFNKEYYIK